ncbi:MAG: hypothetical protein ACLUBP_09260 [Faecalibacterium prausnitzii]
MTQEEQIRLYRLMEKLNWFFHQEMHYLDRETAEKIARECYPEIRDFTYDILWNDLPKEVQEQAHGRGGIPMSTLICSFDGLHDNRVLRYCADFEAHTLHMDTQSETGEKVSVRFTGLLAHWFENVVQDNILFGMDEITVDGFFQQYKDLLGGTISYGFPACCSIEELRKRMEREHIRVFVIDSSLGLCGFVLAQEVELQCL